MRDVFMLYLTSIHSKKISTSKRWNCLKQYPHILLLIDISDIMPLGVIQLDRER